MSDTKTLELSPELQFELAVAALELVAGVSMGVHKRIEREGNLSSKPGVRPNDLVRLREVLNKIPPGGIADAEIEKRSGG